MNKLTKTLLYSLLLCLPTSLISQVRGDEDADMFNRAKQRDQQAIDEAVNGWWTPSMKTVDQRLEWWQKARFGMFVHWGVYSLPAGEWKGKIVSGYAEHLMRKEKIFRAEYLELAHRFNPLDFNADEWIRTASNAGMKYFVITAKHHDGFAMYPSEISDFNLSEQTPFKRDPMAELAAACKKYGVKFGFYYSHAFDWEHPDAPGNDWEYDNPGGDSLLHGGANWFDAEPQRLPKAVKYVNEKAIPQIRELITKYHPDILWFDTPHKLPLSENIRILKAIRETDSNIVVNGRLARSSAVMFGDYKNTADRPAEFFPVDGNWEAIPTTNESYGYHQFDHSHKSVSFFIQLLAKSVSRNGNLLMNIGPMGNGRMDEKDIQILKGISSWMEKNKESIHGAGPSLLPLQSWGVVTKKKNKLYLHVFDWPRNNKLVIGGLKTLPKNATMLSGGKKLSVIKHGLLDVQINLPKKPSDETYSVVVLAMDQEVSTDQTRLLSPEANNRLLAFDARLNGGGFSFGDGKTDRYFIDRWTKTSQSVSWPFRLNEAINAELSIRYQVDQNSGGNITVQIDGQNFPLQISPTAGNPEIRTISLGKCQLRSGIHELKIQPTAISGKNLMQLFQVDLKPISKDINSK